VIIGIVTGASKYFILNKTHAKIHKISKGCLAPLVSRFNQVKGIKFTHNDLGKNVANDEFCQLLNTTGNRSNLNSVKKYLARFNESDRDKVKTFKRRKYWHQPDDNITPDGFLSYMNDQGPVLALNKAGVTCTNSVHRLIFKNKTPEHSKKLFTISLQSTLSQLSAEIVGRSYGSGVLKLEPSNMKNIIIAMPDIRDKKQITRTFNKIDDLFRKSKHEEARKLANDFILQPLLGNMYTEKIFLLETALGRLRSNRRLREG